MSENTDRLREVYEIFSSGGDLDRFDEYVTDDFVEHEELAPGIPPGKEGVKAFFRAWREAFPDLRLTLEDAVEEGDKLAARFTATGTHQGSFMGIMPATGKSFTAQGFDMLRMVDGRAAEHWGVFDGASMMMQLGLMPEPGAPAG
jgi:steroid delta-isomerase-like uncharacterized protein